MVPKGWTRKTLESVVSDERYSIVDGPFGSNLKSEHYRTSGIPVLQSGFVTSGTFIAKEYVYVDEQLFNEQRRSSAIGGDILMAKIGAQAGRCALIPENHPVSIIAGNCLKLTFNRCCQCAEYYWYVLTDHYDRSGLKEIRTETAQPAISLKSLKSFQVLVPPLPEQRKIAQILSIWDKAIATTERLLVNKQQQKKALMQRLLTGKQRFAGFEGEWKTFTLKSVSEVYVSPVDKKALPDEHTVQLCNYTDVYYNSRIFANHKFMQATATQRECERFKINKGDVLITKDSETPTDIAKAAYIAEELDNVLCGYHLAIIRAKDELVDGEFLSYLFQLPHTQYHFFTLATGATRFGLSVGAIENATFYVPHITEQRQIATFLRTIDKELSKILSSLDNLKLQKKALMQQLLTGKRRVKVDEAAA